ncbi:MAG TPA: DoxX family membrane protein [Frankiaceae bacterium]|nr:DoxX family membrane protein [Frankiaceae bacterium]
MAPVRRLGQLCLGSVFVAGALDALRDPAPRAEKAAALGLAGRLGTDDVTLVRANAAAMVFGGLAVATDRLPRLAALGLAASLVPTTLAGHRFWAEPDPERRREQRLHFGKNVGLLGGCLLLASAKR